MRKCRRLGLLVAVTGLALPGPAQETTITFNEPAWQTSYGGGFNGRTNYFALSTDGKYRLETFQIGGSYSYWQTYYYYGNRLFQNYNYSRSYGTYYMRGFRITRVDAGTFTLKSMRCGGQAAIGQLTNYTTGAGSWSLFNGTGSYYNPETITFGSQFQDVTELYLTDPFAAGGWAYSSYWDDLVLEGKPSTRITADPATVSACTTEFSAVDFSEDLLTELGFNGQTNQYLISEDGQYRVESFKVNATGHFHKYYYGSIYSHNAASAGLQYLEGIRITRVDGAPFDFLGMDIYREAAIGQLTDYGTGAGTWKLFQGGGYYSNPEPVSLGSDFVGVTEVYVVDPAASPESTLPSYYYSYWDDLVLRGPGQQVTTITVEPYDSNGDPMGPGHSVVLHTTAGTLLGTIVDQGDGTYTQDLQSNPLAEGTTLTTTVDTVLQPTSLVVNFRGGGAPDPSKSLARTNKSAIPACGGEAILTVWPRNSRGETICRPLTGISFTTTYGTLSGPVTASPDGSYSQTLVADPMQLGASVRAYHGSTALGGAVNVNFTGGGPVSSSRSTVSAIPQYITVCGGEATITFTARNARGETICRELSETSVLMTPTAPDGTMLDSPVQVAPGRFTQVFQATPVATHLRTYCYVRVYFDNVLIRQVTIYLEPTDPEKSTITIDPPMLFLGGRATVTITPKNCAGEVLTTYWPVYGRSTLGYWSGRWTRDAEGNYSNTLNINRTGTADITARVGNIWLDTGISLTVVDPADLGRVIGLDKKNEVHPYMSIQQAVNAVPTDKLVHILATPGEDREVVRFKPDAGNVTLEGLSVTGRIQIDGLRIERAPNVGLRYVDVGFYDSANDEYVGHGIRVWKASAPTIDNCLFRYAQDGNDGIQIRRHCKDVVITNTQASYNTGNGIVIGKGVDATITNCQLRDNDQHGLFVDKRASVVLDGGYSNYNQQHGLAIDKRAAVTVERTAFRYNVGNGIDVGHRASLMMGGSSYKYVYGNRENGIVVGPGATAQLNRCRIDNNGTWQPGGESRGSGLVIDRAKQVTLTNCYVNTNREHGLVIDRATEVALTSTSVRSNYENGIVVGQDAKLVMTLGSIGSNRDHGITVGAKSDVTLDRVYVIYSGQIGVWLDNRATALLNRCQIYANGRYVGYDSLYGYGVFAERGVADPTKITLIGNTWGSYSYYYNRGKVIDGQSTRNIGNYDQILDATDAQSSY